MKIYVGNWGKSREILRYGLHFYVTMFLFTLFRLELCIRYTFLLHFFISLLREDFRRIVHSKNMKSQNKQNDWKSKKNKKRILWIKNVMKYTLENQFKSLLWWRRRPSVQERQRRDVRRLYIIRKKRSRRCCGAVNIHFTKVILHHQISTSPDFFSHPVLKFHLLVVCIGQNAYYYFWKHKILYIGCSHWPERV